MVRKESETFIRYICEKCHYPYDSEHDAQECENKPSQKASIDCGNGYTDNWKIGDLVIAHHHDDDMSNFRLAIITGIKNEYHERIPIFKFITGRVEDYCNFRHEIVMFLTDVSKKTLIEIADKIRELNSEDR